MSRAPVDHYTLLGVAQDASPDDIKKAYRALAKQYHPDVAGPDPEKLEHFKRVKAAYEVLSDPSARSRYDRSRQPKPASRKGRMPGGFYFWEEPNQNEPQEPRSSNRKDRSNDIDLEDIFGDHGGFVDFGFGSGPKGATNRPPPRQNQGMGGGNPVPGSDVSMRVDVPADIAQNGGTVTVTYKRQRRTEDGRGLFEYDEIYDLKVPPGTTHGDTLRSEGWGHAGSGGGAYGDLVCDIRLVGVATPRSTPRASAPPPRPAETGAEPPLRVVPISIQEALLGGRVELATPQGTVALNLPPCTSGGAKFRLRGKGEADAAGRPTDLMIQLRVVTPPLLDDESVKLIERFAELNPYNPRD